MMGFNVTYLLEALFCRTTLSFGIPFFKFQKINTYRSNWKDKNLLDGIKLKILYFFLVVMEDTFEILLPWKTTIWIETSNPRKQLRQKYFDTWQIFPWWPKQNPCSHTGLKTFRHTKNCSHGIVETINLSFSSV